MRKHGLLALGLPEAVLGAGPAYIVNNDRRNYLAQYGSHSPARAAASQHHGQKEFGTAAVPRAQEEIKCVVEFQRADLA